jgi:phage shock protein A
MGFWDWFSRGGRVVRGKANAAMDSIEDATFETTLKQTIQDMKTELRELVDSSADAVANTARLERQHQKIEDQAIDWKKRAKAALQSGREDLARKALGKSKDFDGEAAALEPTVNGAKKISATLQQRIGQLKNRITDAERNAQTLIARRNAAAAQKKIAMALSDVGDSDDAFSTLARFEESVEKEEATALAYDSLAAGNDDQDLASEIAALNTAGDRLEIDDDLAALKAELGAEIMRG